jgi:hypothetical protein
MMKQARQTVAAAAAFALALSLMLGCSSGKSSTDPAASPEQPIAVSEEAADSLERSLRQVQSLEPGHPFEFHATEEEVTSYLSLRYPDAFLRHAQVRITEGKLNLSARMTNPIKGNTQVICHIQMADQHPKVDFELVALGNLGLPGFLRKSLANYVNEAITAAPLEVTITDLQLLEGRLLVSVYRPT